MHVAVLIFILQNIQTQKFYHRLQPSDNTSDIKTYLFGQFLLFPRILQNLNSSPSSLSGTVINSVQVHIFFYLFQGVSRFRRTLILYSRNCYQNFRSAFIKVKNEQSEIQVIPLSLLPFQRRRYQSQLYRLRSLWGLDCSSNSLVVRVPGYRSIGRASIPGALPDFLRSSGSGTGSTQAHEHNSGATWRKSSGSGLEIRDYGRRDP
jgi:hypothetical protein